MAQNDIYSIHGRIKNHIAMKGLGLNGAGQVLVNSYALVLKDLYDFAETLHEADAYELKSLLFKKENFVEYVLTMITPSEEEEEAMQERKREAQEREYVLENRVRHLENELQEECRINGMGGERELRLMAKVTELQTQTQLLQQKLEIK